MDTPPVLRAWRDYDARVLDAPGMYLGDIPLTGSARALVDRLWDLGARYVEIPALVDLGDPAGPAEPERTVHLLSLVRDLTAQAIYTQWHLRLPAGPRTVPSWTPFSHLHPPTTLLGVPDAGTHLARWRATHYLGKCQWRRGPGFYQLRDRRFGGLRRYTLTDPAYRSAVDTLIPGAPAEAVPEPVLTALTAEHLAHPVGTHVCWLPYATRRWTQSAMLI
ncbi:DUF5825 family protein [Streptomyces johnsoniae]|uniref:DUF5825 family protein n=1 Tax=Streptomyces johnsoniae TaxID=3075532 RepID=A0ABU2S5M0_9ACTN|nr:DUF5825 family protein [Streptomyces sp. DSM 41886]MDT0444263.1 DUF5825 family protein [Streptomyces sp. DSM 41886]